MSPRPTRTPLHLALIAVVWAACSLSNLGAATLWDIDEGLNATAAAEMRESGNYVVPTFNYKLRTAKPVLLYWLQVAAYGVFGVNEFAARLPSALAVLLCLYAVYGLGRVAFDAGIALWGALLTATSVAVLGASRFANPDACLLAVVAAGLACFYRDFRDRSNLAFAGMSAFFGLALLAKGPIGLGLPGLVILLFLLVQREWKRMYDPRILWGAVVCLLVAAPWYIFVGVETKGVFLKEFWYNEHIRRGTEAMENHSGPWYYYPAVMLIGLAPWCVFLGPTLVNAVRGIRSDTADAQARRFLLLWAVVTLGVFTIPKTKLPNYVLPAYPPLLLLTAELLVRWARREREVPAWVLRLSLTCLGLIGVGVTLGLFVFADVIPLGIPKLPTLPAAAYFAWVGGVVLAGACGGWVALRRDARGVVLPTLFVTAAAFATGLGAGVLPLLNDLKAQARLAAALPEGQLDRDVRLAAVAWFQPSLVFYCRREVERLKDVEETYAFLAEPREGYLFVGEDVWEHIRGRAPRDARVIATVGDMYTKQRIHVVAAR